MLAQLPKVDKASHLGRTKWRNCWLDFGGERCRGAWSRPPLNSYLVTQGSYCGSTGDNAEVGGDPSGCSYWIPCTGRKVLSESLFEAEVLKRAER